MTDQISLLVADRISVFISMAGAVGLAIVVKWAVSNFIAGMRLRARGFNYHPGLIYRGMECEIISIGLFSSVLFDTITLCESTPIDNSELVRGIVWRQRLEGRESNGE